MSIPTVIIESPVLVVQLDYVRVLVIGIGIDRYHAYLARRNHVEHEVRRERRNRVGNHCSAAVRSKSLDVQLQALPEMRGFAGCIDLVERAAENWIGTAV